ncbi:hypothetical protein N431DRAFT_437551 [Stipitochalara longipes BDJ]|nr:hypothetical protein N431DRAFT_437551 [Stipitochalara longipes BDJ]
MKLSPTSRHKVRLHVSVADPGHSHTPRRSSPNPCSYDAGIRKTTSFPSTLLGPTSKLHQGPVPSKN